MLRIPIYQGEDVELQLTVTSNDAPLDLSTLSGILCYLYNDRSEIFAKYSLNEMEDHLPLTIVNAPAGIFYAKLQSEQSQELAAGRKLFAEIKIKIDETDFTTVANGYYVGTVMLSRTNKVVPATEAPPPLVVEITEEDATTHGGHDGSATAVASGGTPPYSYDWSNGATTATITGLFAGEYTCVVTDADNNTAEATTVVDQPSEPGDAVLQVNGDSPIDIPYPFLFDSMVNMSVKNSIVGNTALIDYFTRLKAHGYSYPGGGNEMTGFHVKTSGGEAYNVIEQEILWRGMTLATFTGGISNKFYGRDFYTEFVTILTPTGVDWVILGVNITGMLSKYSSAAGAEPGNIAWADIRIDLVKQDMSNALSMLPAGKKVFAWEMQDECPITGYHDILDNALGAEHGVDVYIKALTHTNTHSDVSILQHARNITPDAYIQGDAINWKQHHKYTTIDGIVQEWDAEVFALPLIDVQRKYYQTPDPYVSYAETRAWITGNIAAFLQSGTDDEFAGKKLIIEQLGTETPIMPYNSMVAKGLILAESIMLLTSENHNWNNVILAIANYNMKTLFDLSHGYTPYPGYYFRKNIGDWLEHECKLVDNFLLDPALSSLVIRTVISGSECRIAILNPTNVARTIPSISYNGTVISEYHNHTVCSSELNNPDALTVLEFDEDNSAVVRPYGHSLITFEIPS